MILKPVKTRIFKEGESLPDFLFANIKSLKEGSVVVVSSKIVALAEGRVVVFKTEKEKIEAIKKESELSFPDLKNNSKRWFTLVSGMLTTLAGIDESNGNGKSIFLPKDSFKSATSLLKKIQNHYKIKNVGVVIADSRSIPLRRGILGQAIGYAGFKGLGDYRGQKDLFGRKIKYARPNVADTLAGACVLLMGESGESKPLCVIENAPVKFSISTNKKELVVPLKEDKFGNFYKEIVKRKII
jgi:F420-0:gamma-glutamyl ligase